MDLRRYGTPCTRRWLGAGLGAVLGVLLLELGYATSVAEVNFYGVAALSLVFPATIFALAQYLRRFERTPWYIAHGGLFALLTIVSLAHAVDYLSGAERLASFHSAKLRIVCLEAAALAFLAFPLVSRSRRRATPCDSKAPRGEILVLYAFGALYPVGHYIAANSDSFTPALVLQFTLIACAGAVPLLAIQSLYLNPFVSGRVRYAIALVCAVALFGAYMRPVYRQGAVALSELTELAFGEIAVHASVFVAFATLGLAFRTHVPRFLALVLVAQLALAAHAFYSPGSDRRTGEGGPSAHVALARTPSLYILIVDGYLNRTGLRAKGLQDLDIGPRLSERGFRTYEAAFSNYKPTVFSMLGLLDLDHHYYGVGDDWLPRLSGENRLYEILKDHGYETAIIHPSDYLIRGRCRSDVCYPVPHSLGEVGFLLAETIHYRTDFTRRTRVPDVDYRRFLETTIDDAAQRRVLYTHFDAPNHAPEGCTDPSAAVASYTAGLEQANEWLTGVIERIESKDEGAVILVAGDHGSFIADGCTWSHPNVRSLESVTDNLGVLLSVKWPQEYDGRYDARIHSLMDLSWFLVQFLSGGQMSEAEKPSSVSFLRSGGRIYEVVREGEVLERPIGYAGVAELKSAHAGRDRTNRFHEASASRLHGSRAEF